MSKTSDKSVRNAAKYPHRLLFAYILIATVLTGCDGGLFGTGDDRLIDESDSTGSDSVKPEAPGSDNSTESATSDDSLDTPDSETVEDIVQPGGGSGEEIDIEDDTIGGGTVDQGFDDQTTGGQDHNEQSIDDTDAPGSDEQGIDDSDAPGSDEQGIDDSDAPGSDEQGIDDSDASGSDEQGIDDSDASDTNEQGMDGQDAVDQNTDDQSPSEPTAPTSGDSGSDGIDDENPSGTDPVEPPAGNTVDDDLYEAQVPLRLPTISFINNMPSGSDAASLTLPSLKLVNLSELNVQMMTHTSSDMVQNVTVQPGETSTYVTLSTSGSNKVTVDSSQDNSEESTILSLTVNPLTVSEDSITTLILTPNEQDNLHLLPLHTRAAVSAQGMAELRVVYLPTAITDALSLLPAGENPGGTEMQFSRSNDKSEAMSGYTLSYAGTFDLVSNDGRVKTRITLVENTVYTILVTGDIEKPIRIETDSITDDL